MVEEGEQEWGDDAPAQECLGDEGGMAAGEDGEGGEKRAEGDEPEKVARVQSGGGYAWPGRAQSGGMKAIAPVKPKRELPKWVKPRKKLLVSEKVRGLVGDNYDGVIPPTP